MKKLEINRDRFFERKRRIKKEGGMKKIADEEFCFQNRPEQSDLREICRHPNSEYYQAAAWYHITKYRLIMASKWSITKQMQEKWYFWVLFSYLKKKKTAFILKKTGCNLQKFQFPISGNHEKVGFSDIRVNTSIWLLAYTPWIVRAEVFFGMKKLQKMMTYSGDVQTFLLVESFEMTYSLWGLFSVRILFFILTSPRDNNLCI